MSTKTLANPRRAISPATTAMIGVRYGRLMVLRISDFVSRQSRLIVCLCDCGAEVEKFPCDLRRGRVLSCGCLRIETCSQKAKNSRPWENRKPKHDHNNRGEMTRTYRSWIAMRTRCTNPNRRSFKNYGGRGVSVCERWNDFNNFLADMGERPEGTSIDRIDVNGNYEPSNCRWADATTQARNTRAALARTTKEGAK